MIIIHYIFRKLAGLSLRMGNLFVRWAYKIYEPRQTISEKNKKKWYSLHGDETLRVEYLLGPDSVVLDIGGFKGDWCAEIHARYSSTVYVCEPVKQFYDHLRHRFGANEKIFIFPFGLAADNKEMEITVMSESSSVFREENRVHHGRVKERIKLRNMNDFLLENGINRLDLVKINIEGGEYELLEILIESGDISKIDNLQVQFHDFVPDAQQRMDKIKNKLRVTHEITYEYIFVWENWKRKIKYDLQVAIV
jgi:FkbM family methyltransferase